MKFKRLYEASFDSIKGFDARGIINQFKAGYIPPSNFATFAELLAEELDGSDIDVELACDDMALKISYKGRPISAVYRSVNDREVHTFTDDVRKNFRTLDRFGVEKALKKYLKIVYDRVKTEEKKIQEEIRVEKERNAKIEYAIKVIEPDEKDIMRASDAWARSAKKTYQFGSFADALDRQLNAIKDKDKYRRRTVAFYLEALKHENVSGYTRWVRNFGSYVIRAMDK